MNTIDFTKISKEELIKMWEVANDVENNTTSELLVPSMDEFDSYIYWLENNDFGSELIHNLALEIVSNMYYVFRHGMETAEWCDEYGEVHINIPIDRDNPNVKAIVEYCVNILKDDTEYLKEYGITKNKPTKKMPYSYKDIDWNVFIK